MTHIVHRIQLLFMLIVACALLTIAPASAGQWAPVEARSIDDLRAGHDLVIEGRIDRPIRPPTIEDFRVERIGKDGKPVREPLVFGNEQGGPEARRVKGDLASVRLRLRPHQGQRIQRAKPADAADRASLSAATSLEPGVTYRLVWTPRPADGSAVNAKVCTFTIAGSAKPAVDHDQAHDIARPAGPYYLCEILFRDDDTNRLFYGRSIVPRLARRTYGTPAIGFDGKQYIPPPNPGYERIRRGGLEILVSDEMVKLPPPADSTRYYQAAADGDGPVAIAEGDLGTTLPQPKKPGDVRYLVFVSAIYRVQRLERNVEVLRQDRALYDRRIDTMMRELADRRDWLDEDGTRMSTAAAVMQDAPTLRRLRAEIEAYIALDAPTREQTRAIRWPARALMRIADPKDVAPLKRLDEKSPHDMGSSIEYMQQRIEKRAANRTKLLRDEAAPKNR